MAKKTTAYKNQFLQEKYDSLRIVVPKGRKADVEAHAKAKGESVNGLVNSLLRADMGLTQEEWKNAQQNQTDDSAETTIN